TDGVLHFRAVSGEMLQLRSAVLRGASAIDQPYNEVELHGVTVAGATTITGRYSGVTFDGSLAPGGSALDLRTAGVVPIALPRPTDARATVTTPAFAFHADPPWGFVGPPATTPDPGTA